MDIRKEQRRCAALLRHNRTFELISGPRVGCSVSFSPRKTLRIPAHSNRERNDDNQHAPFNSPATPWRRDQTSGRSQHVLVEKDLRLPTSSSLKYTSEVLEKLRMQQTVCTDSHRLTEAQLRGEKKGKLQRHVSIVTIADVPTGSEPRGVSRRDSNAHQTFDLTLRLEPTPHPRRASDEDQQQETVLSLAENSCTRANKQSEGTGMLHKQSDSKSFPVLSGNRQSAKSTWQPAQRFDYNTAQETVDGSLQNQLQASLSRKKSRSILRKESYNAALVQARRRLIRNGYVPSSFGFHTTREFTFSYFSQCENGTSTIPSRRKGGRMKQSRSYDQHQ